MGTQIHALPNYRRVVELVQSGAIGKVADVHVFFNARTWSGKGKPKETGAAPAHLNYELWLGPAPEQPYRPGFHPADWRRYWDFGGGTFADMGCHFTDLAFWALDLRAPTTVQAFGPEPDADAAPDGMRVEYTFPARGSLGAVRLQWYDGGQRPAVLKELGLDAWNAGVLFVGSDGRYLISDFSDTSSGRQRRSPASSRRHSSSRPRSASSRNGSKRCARAAAPPAHSATAARSPRRCSATCRSGWVAEKLDWDAKAGVVRNEPGAAALLARPVHAPAGRCSRRL